MMLKANQTNFSQIWGDSMGDYAAGFFLNLVRQALLYRLFFIDSETNSRSFAIFMLNRGETRSHGRAPPKSTKAHGFQLLTPVSGSIRAFNENSTRSSHSPLSSESTMRMAA